VPAGILGEESRVHHPAHIGVTPPRALAHHFRSPTCAPISTRPATPETMPCLTCRRVTPSSCPGRSPAADPRHQE
jgi:hypothetical protein